MEYSGIDLHSNNCVVIIRLREKAPTNDPDKELGLIRG